MPCRLYKGGIQLKYACYFMTHNYYQNILPSLKSLLCNSDVDKVYLLIEDDDVGFKLPDKVECINISKHKSMFKGSPNFQNDWAWIVLLRTAMTKLFPDCDRILSLDVDTLIVGDISELWNTRIGNNYIAGALDLPLMLNDRIYVNAGVLLWNLKQLRDGKDEELIQAINTRKYKYPEQDCLNALCEGRIYVLNGIYNSGDMSRDCGTPKILHFAGRGIKKYMADPRVQAYKDLPWEKCVYGKTNKTALKNAVPVQKSGKFNLCGDCGSVLIVPKQKYCHECGKPALWNNM